jgi:hypothetical protein
MKCYLCECSDFYPRDGAVRDNPSLKILECAKCGLVMLDSFQHISTDHYADVPIPATIAQDNIYGCQFHPEKSGEVGLKVLRRFLSL